MAGAGSGGSFVFKDLLGSFGNFCFAMLEAVASERLDVHGVRIEFNRGVRGWSAARSVSWRLGWAKIGSEIGYRGSTRPEAQYCDARQCVPPSVGRRNRLITYPL